MKQKMKGANVDKWVPETYCAFRGATFFFLSEFLILMYLHSSESLSSKVTSKDNSCIMKPIFST